MNANINTNPVRAKIKKKIMTFIIININMIKIFKTK